MVDGYSNIGALLRSAREEQHATLEQAARALHIRVRYLQALEDGRLSDLPGISYAKGYLQAYAGYLQLDKAEILRRFEQIEGMLSGRGFFFPQVFSKEKKASNSAVYAGLIGIIIAYGIWSMGVKPRTLEISVIDKPVSRQEKVRLSALVGRDVACLKEQEVLYPPCHLETEGRNNYLPISRQLKTIMQLADFL